MIKFTRFHYLWAVLFVALFASVHTILAVEHAAPEKERSITENNRKFGTAIPSSSAGNNTLRGTKPNDGLDASASAISLALPDCPPPDPDDPINGNAGDNPDLIGRSCIKPDGEIDEDFDDTINGFGGDDKLYGLGGDDTLNGGAGGDTLYGGEGGDTLNGGLNGDEEWDVADYWRSKMGIHINLLNNFFGGGAAGDKHIGIEIIVGSRKADTIIGNNDDNDLHGGQGNDRVEGGGGNDWLLGDEGNDTIVGGEGFDTAEYRWDASQGGHGGITVDLSEHKATDGFGDSDMRTPEQ